MYDRLMREQEEARAMFESIRNDAEKDWEEGQKRAKELKAKADAEMKRIEENPEEVANEYLTKIQAAAEREVTNATNVLNRKYDDLEPQAQAA